VTPLNAANVSTAASIRVCLVGPSSDIVGGQSVQLARLHSRLNELSALTVSFLPVNPRLPGVLRRLQRVKYVRTVCTSVAYFWSLVTRMKDVDVMHAFSASYTSYLLAPLPAMIVARCFGKRVVLNYHSGEADDHLTGSRFARWTIRRLSHEIIVPSGYLVEVFARHELKARSILNFVEIDRIPYRARTAIGPVFLSNRNLELLYNVACTIRAFARVQHDHPDARLTVVGGGSQGPALQSLVAELGARNVAFVGQIAPSEMGRYYDASDIYFNSPNVDNMPVSIIEAFAAGLPVVTTSAGGIPFIVTHGETGLMASPDDDESLASLALGLLREPSRAIEISTRARELCLTRYVWEGVAAEWLSLYCREAASGRHDSSSTGRAVAG
jgi:glycosyltransferase involved in cell wall biosynthesis